MRNIGIFIYTLSILCTVTLLFGCLSGENEERKEKHGPFEPIVEEWVSDYIDEISEETGNRVALGIPGLEDLAGQVIKDGLGDDVQWYIVEVETKTSTDENFVRVRLSRTFTIDVDIKVTSFSEAYTIEVDYILDVKHEVIKDFDIDLASFAYRRKG